jgi:hypothetical protein
LLGSNKIKLRDISRISKSIEFYPCYASLVLFTIHHALCHHNSSHMLNEMFVKLSILRELNMKMCTLVVYRGPISPISKPYFVKKSSNGEFLCLNAHNCTLESKDVQVHSCPFGHGNLIQFIVHFVITIPPTCLMRCL